MDSGIGLNEHPARNTYNCLAATYPSRRPYPSTVTQACENTAYTEAGAQIWAARITARYMESHPPTNPVEALGVFAGVELDSIVAKGGGNKENDFNQIFFSEPAIQRAFNCSPTRQQNCMPLFQPNTGSSVQNLPPQPTVQ